MKAGMTIMRKIAALFLIFASLCAVCGCQNNESDIRGEYEHNTESINIESSVDTAETAAPEEAFSFGTTAENVYVNDFIGIRYELDDGWTFYTDEQIQELNNLSSEAFDADVQKMIEEATVIYDMMAFDSDNLNGVNINLEKVSNLQLMALDIAENYKLLAPIITDTFANMGFENISYEISDIEVDGKTMPALHTTAEINGIGMYQTAFQKKCSGYLANITVTTYFENTTSDLIGNFTWID